MRLITIPLSHYCERARWALDHARVSYVEEQHLQVFSGRRTRALGARRFVPALVGPGLLLKDSADIVAYADSLAGPDRKLYPADRAEIEAFEKPLAARFGVETRRIAYDALLPHRALLLKYNAGRAPWHERWILRAGFPLVARKIREHLKVHPTEVAAAEIEVSETLDRVARQLDGRPYLFGDGFTAADLTFSSLFAILVFPPQYGMPLPRLDEIPDAMRRQVEPWRAHPAGQHAMRMFALHRSS